MINRSAIVPLPSSPTSCEHYLPCCTEPWSMFVCTAGRPSESLLDSSNTKQFPESISFCPNAIWMKVSHAPDWTPSQPPLEGFGSSCYWWPLPKSSSPRHERSYAFFMLCLSSPSPRCWGAEHMRLSPPPLQDYPVLRHTGDMLRGCLQPLKTAGHSITGRSTFSNRSDTEADAQRRRFQLLSFDAFLWEPEAKNLRTSPCTELLTCIKGWKSLLFL